MNLSSCAQWVRATVYLAGCLTFSGQGRADASAGVFAGFGVLGDPGDDLMGFGYGGRGGHIWELPFYLGGLVSVQRGTRDPEPFVPLNSMSYAALEAGYQFEVGRLGIRPTLLVGAALVETTRDIDNGFIGPCVGLSVMPYGVVFRSDDTDILLGVDARYIQTLRLVQQSDNAFPAMGLPIYVTLTATFR